MTCNIIGRFLRQTARFPRLVLVVKSLSQMVLEGGPGQPTAVSSPENPMARGVSGCSPRGCTESDTTGKRAGTRASTGGMHVGLILRITGELGRPSACSLTTTHLPHLPVSPDSRLLLHCLPDSTTCTASAWLTCPGMPATASCAPGPARVRLTL